MDRAQHRRVGLGRDQYAADVEHEQDGRAHLLVRGGAGLTLDREELRARIPRALAASPCPAQAS